MTAQTSIVGRVLGTEDSTPLEFWVAVRDGEFLQLDDVVALERTLPDGRLRRNRAEARRAEAGARRARRAVSSPSRGGRPAYAGSFGGSAGALREGGSIRGPATALST